MDNQEHVRNSTDLENLLKDMVYVRKLNDDEILERLPQFRSPILKKYVRNVLAMVRDYPKCPHCMVRLWHKSIEYGVPEALYCPECGHSFDVENPTKQLPNLGED